MNPNENGSTRPKTLLLLVAVTLLGGFAVLLAQGLRVTSVREAQPGQLAIEYQSDSAGRFRLLRGSSVTNITIAIATNDAHSLSGRFVQPLPVPANAGSSTSPDASFYRIEQIAADPVNVPLTTFTSSPADSEGGIAVTRETILRFSQPLSADAVLNTDVLFAVQGGRKLLCRCELSSDRTTATLFYLENLPAASRIRVTFVGDSVTDFLGRPVDADGNGIPGGIAEIDFDTVSVIPITGTAMIGRVFRSDLAPGVLTKTNVVEVPLANVQIEVIGAEESMRTRTDNQGNFKLQPCPAGRFFVRIDGRTATNGLRDPQLPWAQRDYYPVVEKAWEAIAGRTDNLASCPAGVTNCQGIIYLPLIKRETLQPVSATENTTVTFPAEVIAQNPELAGVSITVPANSLYANDGTRSGRVGIAPVSPDRLPEPLPPGLTHTLDISVQTDGPQNFDQPVPIRFPNLPDPTTGEKLPPGAKTGLWSYNHDKGRWEVVGTMTVTSDGNFVESDPGSGVLQPGWHGWFNGGNNNDCPGCCRRIPPNIRIVIKDFAKASLACAAELTKIEQAISCLIELVEKASAYVESLNQLSESMRNGKSLSKEEALALYNFLVQAKSVMTTLYKCFTDQSPAEKLQGAVNCLNNILQVADDVCKSVRSPPPGCNPSFLERILCKGVDVAKDLVDKAKRLLTFVNNLLKRNLYKLACQLMEELLAQLKPKAEEASRAFALTAIRPEFSNLSSPEERAAFLNKVDSLISTLRAMMGDGVDLAMYKQILEETDHEVREVQSQLDAVSAQPREPGGESVSYYRLEYGASTLRGQSDNEGRIRAIMPARTQYRLSLFFPGRQVFGIGIGVSAGAGEDIPLISPDLASVDSMVDGDGDGMADLIEDVLGTDPTKSDTDNDGIPDGAEIDNGTNPLDGLAAATGIVASADTPGTAVDICAINDIAIIADSEMGISVFNVLAVLNPVRIAQVDTPGTALAVSCSGNLIAVADGSEGLQIVDISDPPAARIVRQVGINALGGGSAQAVASAANLAFVGTTQGSVSMVEIDSGVILQRLELGSAINDLAIEGTTLYAYAAGKLHVLPFALGPMQRTGSAEISNASAFLRPRIFVGNGIAYVTHSRGYHTFDVSAPENPKLIAQGNTTQLSWIQIVPNGSGTALAVRGVNPRLDATSDVSLYDVSNLAQSDVFLTEFDTPGFARAASIYNGLGYVADDKNGMHVVNYLAYDNKKQPPTGELKTSSTEGTVTGGGFVVLRAEVKDDVQVRNVEFFVDGQRLAVDGNFPFETVYRVPTNSTGRQLVFTASLFDTGGNTASISHSPINVVPDNQPPGITIESPTEGQRFLLGDDVPVKATAIDNSGIDAVTFQLNGRPVPVRRLSFYEWQIPWNELPTGTNTLTATATDAAGLSSTSKPVRFVVLKEAISREVSIFNFGPPDVRDAISRELSVFNFGPADVTNAISRELSVFNFGPADKPDAISREISAFNFGPPDKPEAISREISVENQNPAQAASTSIHEKLPEQSQVTAK